MKQIESLIERYFDGTTSLEEEETLRRYFLQEEIPESLEMYRPIFNCISRERETVQTKGKPKGQKVFLFKKSAAYAAGIALLLGITFFLMMKEAPKEVVSMVYIDGKAYTDQENLQEQVLSSLERISSGESEMLSSQIEILSSFQE